MNIHLDIPAGAATSPTAVLPAENTGKNVLKASTPKVEIFRREAAEIKTPRPSARLPVLIESAAKLIVLPAFLGVGKCLIRFVYFFKFCLITSGFVRMVLMGELSKGPF